MIVDLHAELAEALDVNAGQNAGGTGPRLDRIERGESEAHLLAHGGVGVAQQWLEVIT